MRSGQKECSEMGKFDLGGCTAGRNVDGKECLFGRVARGVQAAGVTDLQVMLEGAWNWPWLGNGRLGG